MPAELIQKTDTNKQTFPKINQAIIDSSEAITKSTRADQNSNLAISRMKSVQSQLNQLVIEGDSSVEAAQARVDDEGNEYNTLQERLNAEKNQVKEELENTKEHLQNDYKNFYLTKASEIYLYDLQLAGDSVNQAIQVDEINDLIYTSQGITLSGDKLESFIISRLTLGGKLIDSMTVRYGGHGATFGIQVVENKTYIWSNIIKPNPDNTISTQYLVRFPYSPGTEINSDSIGVERVKEYPNKSIYMTPFTDDKSGLIGLRITDSTKTPIEHTIEVRKIEDMISNIDNVLHSYSFTTDGFQSVTLDGNDLYISFGATGNDFMLKHIDLTLGAEIETLSKPIGLVGSGQYDEDFGEPEGIYMYTDRNTGYKTLLFVLVTDAPGRRRQKLFAFSWNSGVQKFQGFLSERTQNIKLTRDDGKAKRIPSYINSLKNVKEPGWYYMTTAEGDRMDDHPMKGVAGWWMHVSPSTSGPWCVQELFKVSTSSPQRIWRVLSDVNVSSRWRATQEIEL